MFSAHGLCGVIALGELDFIHREAVCQRYMIQERGSQAASEVMQPHVHHLPPICQAVPRVHPGLRRRNRLHLLIGRKQHYCGQFLENTIPIHPLDKTIHTHPTDEIQSVLFQTLQSLLSLTPPGPGPKSPSGCLGQTQASWLLRWTALPGCPILSEDRLSAPCSKQTLEGWVWMLLTGDLGAWEALSSSEGHLGTGCSWLE